MSVTDQSSVMPTLPPRTDPDAVGSWELWEGVMSRLCWSNPVWVPARLAGYDIRAMVQQRTDGTLTDAPQVFLGEHGWSIDDARFIALALMVAANVGDEMAGKRP